MINSLLNPLWDDFIGRRPCLLHRFDKTNEANQATKMVDEHSKNTYGLLWIYRGLWIKMVYLNMD